jgi:threonine dehydrogenase-like Zn-dependent dehydrogenase
MPALVLPAQGSVAFHPQWPTPSVQSGQALIAVHTAGICHTDVELMKGYMGFEGILGHEFVGTVVQAPGHEAWVGQRVCVDINAACDKATTMEHCDHCPHPHHCPSRSVIGIVQHHGAFAQFVQAPVRNLYPVPASVSDQQAVFCEPLAAAFEIVEQRPIAPEEDVVVLGDGKLGLLIAMALASVAPNQVTVIGRHANKLACLEGLALGTCLLEDYTPKHPQGAAVVVEATGRLEGLQTAFNLLRPRGTLVLKSTLADGAPLNLAPLVINEWTLLGSRCGPFGKALEALAQQPQALPVERLIEATYPLSEGLEALAHAQRKGALKILLKP